MSTQENKAISRRFREYADETKGTLSTEEFIAEDAIVHMPGNPPVAFEVVVPMFTMFYSAFSDMHHVFEDQIAEDDMVVTRVTLHGTHTGDFQGIPATGKSVSIPAIFFDCIKDGKLVEHWSMMDTMGLMQQLGVIPA